MQRAVTQTAELLPDGLATDRMVFLTAVDERQDVVGRVWVCLDHPRGAADCAWIYDIEVEAGRRGGGYGRALLSATETEVVKRGVGAIMLNVFGRNRNAIALYESSGYEISTMELRKPLR